MLRQQDGFTEEGKVKEKKDAANKNTKPYDDEKAQKVRALYAKNRELVLIAWNSLRRELVKLDIDNALSLISPPDQAEWDCSEDPFDQSETLLVRWLAADANKMGEIQVRANGTFYAEYDVVRDHPKDVRWFIEAVTAWGEAERVKSELRLLPAI